MSQVSATLQRMQDAGGGGGGSARVPQEGGARERVAELEQQLGSLTQQRLQHLELIQNQQLELQVAARLPAAVALRRGRKCIKRMDG